MQGKRYLVLGIPPSESARGIRQAFCELVRRYHPDHVGSHGLPFLREIVEAYRLLANPERRRNYDRGLADARPTAREEHAEPIVLYPDAAAPSLLPRAVPSLRCSAQSVAAFQPAFDRVARDLRAGEPLRDDGWTAIDVQAVLSPDEAARGGLASLSIPSCEPCQCCATSGRDGSFVCARCEGSGVVESEEEVRVFVPPTVGDATLLEAPLRGLGVHHFYLRLQLRVAPEGRPAGA